jgi:hypothetical protein
MAIDRDPAQLYLASQHTRYTTQHDLLCVLAGEH